MKRRVPMMSGASAVRERGLCSVMDVVVVGRGGRTWGSTSSDQRHDFDAVAVVKRALGMLAFGDEFLFTSTGARGLLQPELCTSRGDGGPVVDLACFAVDRDRHGGVYAAAWDARMSGANSWISWAWGPHRPERR